jgi:uncharacterized protein YfdQ (DUF2303 family)
MEEKNNISDLLGAGSALGSPRMPLVDAQDNGILKGVNTPYAVVPEGYTLKSLEQFMHAPTRKHAAVTVSDSSSFIAYTKKHGSLAECVIYADIDSTTSMFYLIAVINDNAADRPLWRDHTCTFAPKQSVEWVRWSSNNKRQMNQADFATWLEDNQGDVRSVNGSPSGADILAMAQAFEVNADKRVKSHVNLQSGGVRFEFVEDETKDTRTSMEAFRRFTLALPVFDGSSDAYPVEARLKYRDTGGKVSFWYELIRPDRAFKTAVQSELEQIKAGTGFMILQGKP